MNTLTVPKIKDLVHKPSEQYKDIFDTMQKGTIQNKNKNTLEDSSNMTNELTQFFNDLKKTSTLANSTLNNPLNANNQLNANSTLNTNNNSEPLGEPLTSSSSSTYSPY